MNHDDEAGCWRGWGQLELISLAFAWRAQNLDAFGLSNDEGAHLMWAKLAVGDAAAASEVRLLNATHSEFKAVNGTTKSWRG